MQAQVTNLQRSMQQTMAGLQSQQQNTGNQLNRGPGNAFSRFFNNIVSQSRRSGSAVAAGAKQGQHSLLAMAAAGTAAFTAISAVQSIAQKFTSTIAQTAATGRIAAASGVPAQWLSRLQNAAYTRTSADPGQTAESVFGLRQQIERLQAFGEWSDQLKKLSILGIDFTSGDPNDIIQRIFTTELPKYLKSLSLPRATAFGTDIGMSRELTQFYHQYNPSAEMGRVGGISATPEQLAGAEKLAEALRQVETAWNGLLRAIQTANPHWTTMANNFAGWLEKVQKSPEALNALGTAATAVIGVTLVAAVGTFANAVIAANARLMLQAAPLMALLGAAMGAKQLISPNAPSREAHDMAMSNPGRYADFDYWLGRGVYGTPHGPRANDKRGIWERYAPGFLGGKSPPTGGATAGAGGSGGGAGGSGGGAGTTVAPGSSGGAGGAPAATGPVSQPQGDTIARGVAFFMGKGLTREQSIGIVARLAHESGGGTKLDPNIFGGYMGRAYGIAQWLGSRRPDALATGGDLDKQLELVWAEMNGKGNDVGAQNALKAIRASKNAGDSTRAMELFERAGEPKFTEKAARTADAWSANGIGTGKKAPAVTSAAATPTGGKTGPGGEMYTPGNLPPGVKLSSQGRAYASDLDTMDAATKAKVEQSMAAIRAAQSSGKNWSAPVGGATTNTTHSAVQIDKIEVTTQATNPYAIGGGIAGAIKNNLIASQSNTGLE